MRSGSDLLIYVLIIAGVLLFNYVMQQLAKKARQQQEEQAGGAQAESSPPSEDEPLEDIWGRPPPLETVGPAARAPRVEAPAVPERRAAAGLLFRTRHDLRHAVVVMTVLGPCRALEPPDSR
jgi:hypothetical protein